jgi:hypothetical protein
MSFGLNLGLGLGRQGSGGGVSPSGIIVNNFTQVLTNPNRAASYTASYDNTGAFLVIAVSVVAVGQTNGISDMTATYNGVSMTRRAFRTGATSTSAVAIFTLAAPATGANNIVVNTPGVTGTDGANSCSIAAWALSGVGGFVAAVDSNGSGTLTLSRTAASDGALLLGVGAARNAGTANTISAGWTARSAGNTGGTTNADHGFINFDRITDAVAQTATVTFAGSIGGASQGALIELSAA